ncbi:calmodulin-regulated spectrin-associated protein 1-like isoform X6 [Haliotis rufescens]|uniref:calmodulin-regulated spectrin-associated protein 1-like isoform X6 n=1 Tax=Haliotis rufescens TaxID=6454 RepID=UPI00201EBC97|nr:calmodulin-regulated spectrin-associated protein 1-like isoform X6 [Haliotis rufescens]
MEPHGDWISDYDADSLGGDSGGEEDVADTHEYCQGSRSLCHENNCFHNEGNCFSNSWNEEDKNGGRLSDDPNYGELGMKIGYYNIGQPCDESGSGIGSNYIDMTAKSPRISVQGQPYLDRTLINQFHHDTSHNNYQDVHCDMRDVSQVESCQSSVQYNLADNPHYDSYIHQRNNNLQSSRGPFSNTRETFHTHLHSMDMNRFNSLSSIDEEQPMLVSSDRGGDTWRDSLNKQFQPLQTHNRTGKHMVLPPTPQMSPPHPQPQAYHLHPQHKAHPQQQPVYIPAYSSEGHHYQFHGEGVQPFLIHQQSQDRLFVNQSPVNHLYHPGADESPHRVQPYFTQVRSDCEPELVLDCQESVTPEDGSEPSETYLDVYDEFHPLPQPNIQPLPQDLKGLQLPENQIGANTCQSLHRLPQSSNGNTYYQFEGNVQSQPVYSAQTGCRSYQCVEPQVEPNVLLSPEDEFYDAVDDPTQYDAESQNLEGHFSAKLRASLSWILHKAYRDSIPAEFKDPFYETDQGAWQMKPHLVRLLTSSEIYCQACTNMFPNRSSQWQGHWSIIQVLSRKGIYVTGSDDSTVTETVLIQTAPFNMDAHVSLITSLMVAYTCEQVTVERVVQAVRRLTTFNASSELPSGAEDTVMFWINKVCSVAQSRDPKSQHVLQGETSQKVRIVSRTPVGEPAQAPVIHDLMADLSDGCSLAVLVSFYCPNLLSYSDICLKENLGIADSLYNLRLVKTFCEHNMPAGCFPFTYEDLLYTPHTLRENILAFLGELFYWFEIQKFDGSRPSTGQALAGVPQVSNATKRSFHQAEDTQLTSTPELNKATSPSSGIPPRQGPLLHKRHQGKTGVNEEEPVRYLEPPKHPRRAHSLSSPQERDTIRQSVIAWEEPASPTHRQQGMKTPVNQSQDSQSSALLANVSIDSELNESFTDDQLGSMNFDLDKSQSPQPTFSDRQTVPSNLLDPSHPDYLEIESVNSRQSNMNSSRSEKLEPLMPAIIRPAKEKHSNHTKAQERGDPFLRKKSTSPTKPRKSRSSPVSSSVTPSQGDITVEAVVTLPGDSSQVMSSDETVVTPLPDDLLTARSGDGDCDSPDSQQKGFEAFYINPEISVEVSLPPVSSQSPRALSAGSHSDESEVTASYTIDQTHTLETARAAGIPVVQSGDGVHIRRTTSRDGSVSSSRSSGDFSDHESHKIHLDHKARETADLKTSLSFPSRNRQSPDVVDTQKPKLVITDQLPKTLAQTLANKDKRPLTTNFAEIKRIKETYGNIDNSGLVYMQNGQEPKGNGNTNTLKSAFYRKQNEPGGKKTTFATLPNETTWIAQRASQASAAQAQSNGAESQPVSSELSQLRMKLDEKRKEIEKKKQRMEMQQNKMRRRLGKDAFYRVVSRHMDDVPDGTTAQAVPGDRTASEIGEMLGHQVPGATDAHRPTSFVEPSSHAAQRSRPFSREGIQQTIDNVRKKWFKEDDLVGGAKPPDDECMTLSQEEKLGPLLHVQSQPVPSPPSQAMTDSQHSTSSQHSTGSQPESFEVYDSSLDKLNKSLTDLQGEIARLSLQQEQIKFLQSPQGYAQADMQMHLQGGPMTNVSNIPPQSFPKQTGYTTPPQQVTQMGQGGPHQPYATSQNQFVPGAGSQGFPAPATSQMYVTQSASQKHVPYQPSQTLPYASPIMAATSYQPVTQPTSSHHIPQYSTMGSQMPTSTHHPLPTSTPIPPSALSTERKIPTPPGYTLPPHSPDAQPNADTASEDSSSTQDTMANGNGFFVSFGDETPKRAKPKLGKDRTKKEQKPETPVSNPASAAPQAAAAPAALASSSLPASASPSFSNTSAPSQPPPSVHTNHHTANTGFVIEERELTPDKVQNSDDEMAKKRERILQMQVKRKEEQERKRLEKEDEAAKQREALRLKQEEAERKKAEEKARRDQIYQQYLHRKQHQEDEENGIERPQERPAKSKPRPKSMFVKATNSPPHDDEGLVCSLDDLSARAFVIPSSGGAASSASSSPRPTLHIPHTRGKLRKAVSCNTLTQNGRPGGMTYRRPPSPDLYRLQQRRNRSNDSSETGSNAGSDYTGPKLFVKPSSKSNRNIIMNAISHCCLAGCVNTDTKNKVLEIISQSDAKHFLILFRDGGCQFKGLYTYAPEIEEIFKIHGVGPKQITNKMVEKFYKYNSGAKSFTEVKSTKHISVSIDAVVVHNALWKTSKPGAAKK